MLDHQLDLSNIIGYCQKNEIMTSFLAAKRSVIQLVSPSQKEKYGRKVGLSSGYSMKEMHKV